jgi:hypothetical protein
VAERAASHLDFWGLNPEPRFFFAVTSGQQRASNVLPCYTLHGEGFVGPRLKELSR